jgi:hypothetical protein
MKRFGKKKKEPESQPAPATAAGTQATSATGSAVLFRISTELTEIDDDKVSSERFEPPAGWTKTSP